jgi:hypothetical protein
MRKIAVFDSGGYGALHFFRNSVDSRALGSYPMCFGRGGVAQMVRAWDS